MSSEPRDDFLRFVIAGCLRRDTILPISAPPQIDLLGGNLPYAAVGLSLWGKRAGLLGKTSPDYPQDWLDQLTAAGFDISGIKPSTEAFDTRRFIAHTETETSYRNPVHYFAERGLHFPTNLLGYNDEKFRLASHTQPSESAIKISDIPKNYLEASAVHICPIDYISHVILPTVFRQGRATTITLAPDPGYMTPSFWDDIQPLISELTAFITMEQEIRELFQGRKADLWEMAEVLAGFGPEYLVIQTASQGYFLLDRVNNKRWIVPKYPCQNVDPTGIEDAFAGGFLAGYRQNYDPLEGVLYGSISASLVAEGSGVFYALGAMPGLVDVRLNALRDLVRRV